MPGSRGGSGVGGGVDSSNVENFFGALDALPRLCAATVWLSPESAREVWSINELVTLQATEIEANVRFQVSSGFHFSLHGKIDDS